MNNSIQAHEISSSQIYIHLLSPRYSVIGWNRPIQIDEILMVQVKYVVPSFRIDRVTVLIPAHWSVHSFSHLSMVSNDVLTIRRIFDFGSLIYVLHMRVEYFLKYLNKKRNSNP